MAKDRSWMYGSIDSSNYIDGVLEFCKFAVEHQERIGSTGLYCPCVKCVNVEMVDNVDVMREHILRRGFRPQYHVWIWHGESGIYEGSSDVPQEEPSPHDDVAYDEHHGDAYYDEDEDGDMNCVDEMMEGMEEELGKDSRVFETISEASQTPLYPGCTEWTKLSAVLELYSIKSESNWTDGSFTRLLKMLSRMLPKGNELPNSNYYAKKLMCPFGLEYQKIHACPNDCVLYRNSYEQLAECPKCGEARYEREGAEGANGPPAKVLWYLPIIPRFKRLFSIKKDAKNLRWHVDGRKKGGFLQHPADGPEWKTINRLHKSFGDEDRNLRLGLCTDGMNPFGTLSSKHSTWPVLLTIYNLPPWLCMKRKYLMLALLISGPTQPGNDIDVYLAPLVDDLRKLWDEGVSVFDAHANETFTLRAMLLCTLNDYPAYGNLTGYKNKGKKACPICIDELEGEWIGNKHVYMDHRKFLPRGHPYRKKKKAFNGKVEDRVARRPLTGNEVYEQLKGVETVFGKPNKKCDGLWKKVSIFWTLPYWKDLQVRHCIDVMHLEKNVCDAIVGTLFNIPFKTKDGKAVREYLERVGLRPELWPQVKESKKRKKGKKSQVGGDESKGKGKEKVTGKRKKKSSSEKKNKGVNEKSEDVDKKKNYLPPACYTLSKEEK